ncbi:hypothetical protein [Neorhizobium sp. NCHU2750]|uniref:hypothetical protein n=1 Tax=Neorhizobium sp. NCHU2750 TaxID=1825976 RepID=UPI000E708430|nr:hypothetical protein NCHU2750_08190 [Neorhizobium sp. NCHU2750]
MLARRSFLTVISAVALFSAPMASAAEFDWNGTWSGKAANGRSTVIKIAKGKVVSWSSNGQSQKIGASSVSKSTVSITHAEGAKVTLTPKGEDAVTYTWRGTNASSSVTLKKG